ncbi:hypothetical protein [Variovorax sp. UC122_21]|jgi:hypothetical protein|uniref:hypothetical protein n=1 Tax=Variovorax TaxID=34072 RepID=UPI001933E81C|nr:hypothetical protein INQ48_40740 [Variovorax paradoxus]
MPNQPPQGQNHQKPGIVMWSAIAVVAVVLVIYALTWVSSERDKPAPATQGAPAATAPAKGK